MGKITQNMIEEAPPIVYYMEESVTEESKDFPVETDDTMGIEVEIYRAKNEDDLRVKACELGLFLALDISLSKDGVEMITPVVDYKNIDHYIAPLVKLHKEHYAPQECDLGTGGIHIHLSMPDEGQRRFLASWLYIYGHLLPDWIQRKCSGSWTGKKEVDFTKEPIVWEDYYKVRSKGNCGAYNVSNRGYGIEFRGMGSENIDYLGQATKYLHRLKELIQMELTVNAEELLGQDEMFKEHKRAKEVLLNAVKEWGDETDKKENVIIR